MKECQADLQQLRDVAAQLAGSAARAEAAEASNTMLEQQLNDRSACCWLAIIFLLALALELNLVLLSSAFALTFHAMRFFGGLTCCCCLCTLCPQPRRSRTVAA